MWIYKVISSFKDLEDNRHLYSAGDIYPREGVTVSKERINELKTDNNKVGKPLIKAERKKKGE